MFQAAHRSGWIAAKPEDQDAGRVGIGGEPGEQGACAGQIVAQLRAAMRMREGMDAIDTSGMARHGRTGDLLGRQRDASDSGQDPYLIARRGAAIGSRSPASSAFPWLFDCHAHLRCRPRHSFARRKRRREIMRMDMRSGWDGPGRTADRHAIFPDDLPCYMVTDRDLVPLGNRFSRDSGCARQWFASRYGAQGDGDTVLRMDDKEGFVLSHDCLIAETGVIKLALRCLD